MFNLTDKELDRLSREAAELYEPDESSLSWSRLEQKLTEQMPGRPPDSFRFGRIRPLLWAPAAILITGISIYFIKTRFYTNKFTQNIPSISKSITDPTLKDGGNRKITTDQAGVNSPDSTHMQLIDDGTRANSANTLELNQSSQKKSHVLRNTILSNEHAKSESGNGTVRSRVSMKKDLNSYDQNELANIQNQKKAGNHTSATLGILGMTGSDGGEPDVETNIGGNLNNSVRIKTQLSLPSIVSNSAAVGHVRGNDSLLTKFDGLKSVQPEKSTRVNRSLNIGIAFGPDYTDAGGISNNQLGNNIGLTIGYYLTSKLSINTGFMYSNKFYWSQGEKPNTLSIYSPAYNTFFATALPVELVNGSSSLWELPLTIRYDFAHNNKTRFFANAGLSSYFIMKQTHIYFTHNGYAPQAWKATNNEQINYWFDVANISLGFETNIGKGFSFQVEPFAKLPLKKMGDENLRLNSYGVLLSFRYSPVLSRSKK